MSKRGRKRKDGARHPCGRLRDMRDTGSDGVQRRIAMYAPPATGEHIRATPDTVDPIGRAYLAGLLDGYPVAPEVIRDAARDLAALYWRIYGIGAHRDQLARFLPASGSSAAERERALEGALNARLRRINTEPRSVRAAVDALVIDPIECDHGPAWLDRIIFARKRGDEADSADRLILDRAMIGLLLIC